MDSNNNCFICADDCTNSYFNLINLTTKKFKTKYTSLIGELINPEYELRVTKENKICERCVTLCEHYDELQQETRTVKSVLARQIAHTYSIDTNQSMVYMDKSKIFVELPPLDNESKYSCKLCHWFTTDCLDTVNAHILYHKIIQEDQIQTNEILKETIPSQKRTRADRREIQKKPETAPKTRKKDEVQLTNESPLDLPTQEYDEETLQSLIDLELLDDPLYNSNLKNHQCMVTGCPQEFTFINDYVRHLKLKHKSTLNHIFAAVKANVKRPNKVGKLMCPYCFTVASNNELLEKHVRQHEETVKSNSFSSRINCFDNIMRSSRCTVCDCETFDLTMLECTHEAAKNGMTPKKNCSYCSREFYSDKLYNNHLALEHGHCFVCGSTCDDKVVLGDHIRSHLT